MVPIRIATRSSPLALWQAQYVGEALRLVIKPQLVRYVHIETHGDRDQASALSTMGGFGVFTKAIQNALLEKKADLAVHSLKDLPTLTTEGVELTGTPVRGPTGDAFVSEKHLHFEALPKGAKIGTSSLRRRAMLLKRRPDLELVELRGNVDTRIRKLTDLQLDGIVLAEAGLVRLGLANRITEILDSTWMLPAVGQGAIGLECRTEDATNRDVVKAMNDPDTWAMVTAERTMLFALGGGCLVPIGAQSRVNDGVLTIRGMVLNPNGTRAISATHKGPANTPKAIGLELAAMLKAEGADELLATTMPT